MSGQPDRAALPGGVVTFLLTDVAGSTRVWTAAGSEPASAMARQVEIIGAAVSAHGGIRPLEQGEGDSVVAVFERASDALAAAIDAQLALAAEAWGRDAVTVRMAVHTGEAEFRDEQTYGGAAIIRCARLRELAEGGQVLVSAATAELASDRLPVGASLVPVGEVTLRGLARAERVHQLVHEQLAAAVAELGPRGRRLGAWPTPLIGRRRERREVSELLDKARLVTITGAGGAGKTRLAHAVATDLVGAFEDVAWVDLARVTSDADVATAVLHACGVREAPGVELVELLTGFLQARELLVVLDNCEHVLGPCAALTDEIRRRAPRTRLLATSREPLGVAGEVTWRIPSLETPPEGPVDPESVARFDAVELFVERAQAADPTFDLDEDTASGIAAICRRLDGLPLAIELAAARLRSMSVRAVSDGLDDRFRLLTGGARTALPRQQTLFASVEWSYRLLDDDEQQLLRRLGVLVAPFTVEAAEAIAADGGSDPLAVFDLMSRLVDKSLVQRVGERYRLLETIRQFALDRARDRGELEELRDSHLRWFSSRATRWGIDREILTEAVVAEISVESPDLLAALDWSLRAGSHPAVELLWPLGRRWSAETTFAEASRVADEVLERFEPGSEAWLRALAPMADALAMAADLGWTAPAGAALAALGDAVDDLTRSHLELAVVTEPTAFLDPDRLTRLRSLMELGRRNDNRSVEYGAAAMLAYGCAAAGVLDEARRLCAWLDRRLPDDAELRSTLDVAQGFVALLRCEFEMAQRAVSRQIQRPHPDLRAAALTALTGIYTADPHLLAIGLDAYKRSGSMGAYEPWRDVFQTVEAVLDGSLDTALVLLDQVRQAGALFNQSPLRERLYVQLALATGRVDAATARWQTLRSLPDMRSAAPYAASSLHLVRGDIAMEAGELRDAEEAAQQALAFTTAELPLVAVDAVELLAVVLARRQRTDDAGRLLGATEAFRERTGYRLRFPLRCAQVDALRPELDALDLSNGAALSLADAVALAQGTRGKRGRPSFGWDSLTPTEARVVELVSEGCSNSEIAEKLFIGVATVKTHLVHVYEKLGLRSRTELAAAAARREPSC